MADILNKLRAWASRWRTRLVAGVSESVPRPFTVMVLACVIGVGAGCLTFLLKFLLSTLWDIFHDRLDPDHVLNWRLLLFPIAGLTGAYVFQRFVLRQDISLGTAKIRSALNDPAGNYIVRGRGVFGSVIGCSLTVGFGSSAGSEGPSAYCGASLGSSLGRLFNLQQRWIRVLVAVGAGAGIAGIFKAPMGGILYTLEVLEMEMSTVPVLALVLACIISTSTSGMISGSSFDMAFFMEFPFETSSLVWVAIIGFVCGLYSLWYVSSKNWFTLFFNNVSNPWHRVIIAGVMMSLAVFLIPGLYGEGGRFMAQVVNGKFPDLLSQGILATDSTQGIELLLALGAILLIKGPLVAAANNGGGVAGEMVPAMFIGCIAGYTFSLVLNQYCGMHLPVWYLSLVGMAAMLGNSTHAPLMSVFIVMETTNTLQYLPAYMLCALVSYCVMKTLNPASTWLNAGRDDLADLIRLFRRLRHNPPKQQ